jgi:starch synthase
MPAPKKKTVRKVAKKTLSGNSKTRKKILLASSEAVPFAKSGGMADVCGALPKALSKLGHDVRLVLPRYWCVGKEPFGLKRVLSPMGVVMGTETFWCEVFEGEYDGVKAYFIEHDGFFGRAGLYDDGKWEYPDNALRFSFFSKACIQLCRDLKFEPDVIHCNDWQTALIPAFLKTADSWDAFFNDTATVLTIHNIGYQGVFPGEVFDLLGIWPEHFTEAKFESWGKVHFLKAGIFFADSITAVSPTYARELLTPEGGTGLAPYIERRRDDLYGVLNGADYDHWCPEEDKLIPANYSVRNMAGKAKCKKALQEEFGLKVDPNIPIIGIVSRMAHQKGLDLVAPVIKSIVNDMVVQFAILGSGEKRLEDLFGGLPAENPGSIGAWIGFNNHKAHLIEAGADFFLMPSLYEPCGLNQIYSMKYGTLPIVRDTGGLRDTVEQYDEATGNGTGFKFKKAEPSAVYYTVGWAVSTYYDRPRHFRKMRRSAMEQHFSWEDSAIEYEKVYYRAMARRADWR